MNDAASMYKIAFLLSNIDDKIARKTSFFIVICFVATPYLSIVIPTYNSERSFPEIVKELHLFCIEVGLTYEIIAVNDGSTDATTSVIKSLISDYPNLKLINLKRNYGAQSATLCGLIHAIGIYTVTIDDDLQYTPTDIRTLLFAIDRTNVKLMYGYAERVRKNSLSKSFFKYVRKIVLGMSGLSIHQSSFRLITTSSLSHLKDTNSFVFLVDNLIKKEAKPHSYVLINRFKRKYGTSKYSFKRTVQQWFRFLIASSKFGEFSAMTLLLANILLLLKGKLLAALFVISIALLMIYLTIIFKWRIRKSFEIKEKVNF